MGLCTGHLQHNCHDGTMACGNFKTGNGEEFPVWLAYFAESESTSTWNYVAKNLKVGRFRVGGQAWTQPQPQPQLTRLPHACICHLLPGRRV